MSAMEYIYIFANATLVIWGVWYIGIKLDRIHARLENHNIHQSQIQKLNRSIDELRIRLERIGGQND